MIQLKNIKKVYLAEDIETTALNNVSLDIKEGEFVSVMGPSGCGKSTLMNILGMIDTPAAGEYMFLGTNVAGYSEKQRSRLRKNNIGFIFQSFNLIDELTVAENVELPLVYRKMPAQERRQRVEKVLEQVQIAHRRNHFPQQLSGGQQQRAAVARAIVGGPKLILADEPTGNLDSVNGDEVIKMLAGLNKAGTTIVMVTHSPSHAECANRIVHLFDGQIVTEDYKEKFHL